MSNPELEIEAAASQPDLQTDPQGTLQCVLIAGLEKGLAIIEAFDQEKSRISISEFAEGCGLTRGRPAPDK